MPRAYWFTAKRYGWGWGWPTVWQGWVALLGFIALVVIGAVLLRPRSGLLIYLIYVGVLSALFIGLCWLKGEPPRWRWGDRE
jgi:hypothetical protein